MKSVAVFSIVFLVFMTGCETFDLSERTKADLEFKKITPKMDLEMAYYLKQGCKSQATLLDKDLAQMYSLIPGGGQFYTGETKKGWYYLFGSILIIPYFASFQDAQNSVDYYNSQYNIDYCREKLHLVRQLESKQKNK